MLPKQQKLADENIENVNNWNCEIDAKPEKADPEVGRLENWIFEK